MAQLQVHMADTGDHKTDKFVNMRRWRPGDIVDIYPDDHVFGRLDIGPHVKLVKVDGVVKSEIEHLMGRDIALAADSQFESPSRIWRFTSPDTLPDRFNSLEELLSAVEMKPRVELDQ